MTSRKQDLIAKIAASNERRSEWPRGVAYLAQLIRLRGDLDVLATSATGLSWHIPVALIGCVEAFFKESFANLIDAGQPYIERATDLKIEHLRLADLLQLQGRQVSVGEFVAQQQSYSSLMALNRTASKLSESDFLDDLKMTPAAMPWQRASPRPALSDPADTYRLVEESFRLRHIVCHEGSPPSPLSIDIARNLHAAAEDFLVASFYWFAALLLRHVPATHRERKELRLAEAGRAEEDLERAQKELSRLLPPERQLLLAEAQSAWSRFAELDATFAASTFAGGLMESEHYLHWLALHRGERARRLNDMKDDERL